MAIIKNLAWLRGKVARHLTADTSQADDAFGGPQSNPYQWIDDAINEYYKTTVLDAASGADPDLFKFSEVFTWPGSQLAFRFPPGINRITVMSFLDITAGLPGRQITPSAGYNFSQEVYWSTLDTLTWANTGPDSTVSLLVTHRAVPTDMVNDMEEPRLIPYEYRDMLHWGATALALTDRLGDDVPERIDQKIKDWEWRYRTAIGQLPTDSGSYTSEPTPVLPTILP